MLSIKCRYDGEWCKSLQWNKCREQFVIAGVELVTKVKSNRKTWQRKYTVIKVEFHFIESGSHPETESEIEIVTSPHHHCLYPHKPKWEDFASYRLSDNNFSNLYVTRKVEMAGLRECAMDRDSMTSWLVDGINLQSSHWPVRQKWMWWGQGVLMALTQVGNGRHKMRLCLPWIHSH